MAMPTARIKDFILPWGNVFRIRKIKNFLKKTHLFQKKGAL